MSFNDLDLLYYTLGHGHLKQNIYVEANYKIMCCNVRT